MGICLSSALALGLALQGGGDTVPPADSLAAWWGRVRGDSTDVRSWLQLGQAYVARASAWHEGHRATDSTLAAAALDTAEQAFARAAQGPPSPLRDTALVFRVFTWGETALLAWERGGIEAAARLGIDAPEGLRLPAVVAELGENLLRACPSEGVLLTADDIDTYATWFLRFGRRMRPDLLVLPWQVWRDDPVLRDRVADELRLPRPPRGEPDEARVLTALAQRRPLCASVAFAQPPGAASGLRWRMAPLVWVSTPRREMAPGAAAPGDFVFEAARLARDGHEAWAGPVLALYYRAAARLPALCAVFATFALSPETGCRGPG